MEQHRPDGLSDEEVEKSKWIGVDTVEGRYRQRLVRIAVGATV